MSDINSKPDTAKESSEKISSSNAESNQPTPNSKFHLSNDTSPTSILVSKTDYGSKTYLPKTDSSNQGSLITSSKESGQGVTTPKSVTIDLSANKLRESLNSNPEDDEDNQEANGESTPLIPRSNTIWSMCDKVLLVTFILMVIVGLLVGITLLLWLGYERSHYHLVVKSQWTTIYPTQEMLRLKLPLHNVSLIEINASDINVCGGNYYYSSCVRLIQRQNMNQLKEPDILYNFIVDQDGTIYEGRGWENCTCNGIFSDDELTIGILVNDGHIGHKVPMYVKNFLGNTEKKLEPCFTVTTYNDTALKPIVERVKQIVDWDKC